MQSTIRKLYEQEGPVATSSCKDLISWRGFDFYWKMIIFGTQLIEGVQYIHNYHLKKRTREKSYWIELIFNLKKSVQHKC
jgi:hypothetical protein